MYLVLWALTKFKEVCQSLTMPWWFPAAWQLGQVHEKGRTDDAAALYKLSRGSVIWLRITQDKFTIQEASVAPCRGAAAHSRTEHSRPRNAAVLAARQLPCPCSGGKLWEPREARPGVTLVTKLHFSAESREKGSTKISFPLRARPTLCPSFAGCCPGQGSAFCPFSRELCSHCSPCLPQALPHSPTSPPLTLPSTSAASLPSPEGSLFI